MRTSNIFRKVMIAAWGIAVLGFGVLLAAYARSLPPTVRLGASLPVYMIPRMALFGVDIALFHMGLLRGIHGLRGLGTSRGSGFFRFITGVFLIILAIGLLAFTLMISFPQY